MIRERLQTLVETKHFQRFIILIIVLNAITLGLETAPELVGEWMGVLLVLDTLFLAIFTVEIGLKLVAYRLTFFRSGWNHFDFAIVAVSYLPFIEGLSVLRALRVLRLISTVPAFRKVTQAFFAAMSGLVAVGAILLLVFYVGAVMATKLFGATFPEWFGTIGRSLYSLFQVMTLESWSMGIVRPVMEVYPYAWAFFVPFIFATTFAALNLLIGVIVNSMQTLHDKSTQKLSEQMNEQDKERAALKQQLQAVEETLRDIQRRL